MPIQRITSGILANGAIVAADIADGIVTNAKLAGSITSDKITSVSNTAIAGLIQSAQIGSANASVINAGTLAGARLPAGSVLQVVQGSELSSETVISSGSYTDAGISVSITPSAASSKILLLATYHINIRRITGTSSAGCDIQIADGSNNNVYTPTYSTGLSYYANMNFSDNMDLWTTSTMTYLDSPSTTSSVTYKIRAALISGDYVRFRGGHIIAMEIAG